MGTCSSNTKQTVFYFAPLLNDCGQLKASRKKGVFNCAVERPANLEMLVAAAAKSLSLSDPKTLTLYIGNGANYRKLKPDEKIGGNDRLKMMGSEHAPIGYVLGGNIADIDSTLTEHEVIASPHNKKKYRDTTRSTLHLTKSFVISSGTSVEKNIEVLVGDKVSWEFTSPLRPDILHFNVTMRSGNGTETVSPPSSNNNSNDNTKSDDAVIVSGVYKATSDGTVVLHWNNVGMGSPSSKANTVKYRVDIETSKEDGALCLKDFENDKAQIMEGHDVTSLVSPAHNRN